MKISRIIFCYIILILWVISSPIFKILFKTKFCQKFVKKIFFILNRFLLKSNKICWNCGDPLNLDTNIKGWIRKKCYSCKWMEI